MKHTPIPEKPHYPFGDERIVIWFDNPNDQPVGVSEADLPCLNKVIDRAFVSGTRRLASVVLHPLTEAELGLIRKSVVEQGGVAWIRSGDNYVSRWQDGHHQH